MNFDYYQSSDEESTNINNNNKDDIINKKKKRKFTKDDAIYGIFNDGWGEYENEDDNLNEEELYKLKKRYQTPVGFVASGIYEPNSKNKEEDMNIDENEENDNEETKKEKKEKKKKPKEKKKQPKKKSWKKNGNDQEDQDDDDDGDIENKRVGGIGAMLLSKMGYKGTGGLGKGGTGMVEPIKVFVRPKNAGLSSVTEINNDKLNESSSDEDSGSDSESGDENKRSLGWKKKEKVNYDFDEHISNIKPQHKHHHHLHHNKQQSTTVQKQIIIDMSGPETKLINNFKDINKKSNNNQQEQNENIKPLSEFKFNIELLFKFKELEIDQLNSKIKYERDRIENLNRGQDKLKQSIENDNKKINSINELIKLLDEQLQQQQQQNDKENFTIELLKEKLKFFEILKTSYPKEYKQYQLFKLVKELIEPILKELINKWNIEENPIYLLKQIHKLKLILENSGSGDNSNFSSLSNYQFLLIIKSIILPKFKQFLRNQWNVKEPFTAATLISKWSRVLPEVVQEILLEQSILPKLKIEIEKWNPQIDPVPIHQWLLPWVPFLREELKTFFPSIRQKIISGLVNWEPEDESAFEILFPWKDVFESNTIQSIINRFILPKLINCLNSIQFLKQIPQSTTTTNPDTIVTNEIDYLIKWKEFLNLDTIVTILDQNFFLNWIQFLFDWLNQSGSNFEEISNWYSWWKNKIPNEIKQYDSIKSKFSVAINLMKKSMNGEIINLNDYKSILNNNNNNTSNNNKFSSVIKPTTPPIESTSSSSSTTTTATTTTLDNLSMKQMIEQIALSNGILFIPSQKKNDKGQQIYTFDRYSIVIEKDLILLNNNGKWEPANIQLLLNNCLNNKK